MNETGLRLQSVLTRIQMSIIKSLPDILAGLLLLALFALVAWILRHILRQAFNRAKIDKDVAGMVVRIAFFGVLTIGVFEALGQMHVNLAALGLGVGLLSFGIGFALKDILSNFLAGILILITRPFVNGDQIRIKEFEGTIESIEMRGTILRTYDGRRVIIPNSDVYTNPVINNTSYDHRRTGFFVTVDNASDLKQVAQIIHAALETVPEVLKDPAPDVLVEELGDFGVKLEVRVWTAPRQLEALTSASAAIQTVKEALGAHHINMPFPTQVVILKRVPQSESGQDASKNRSEKGNE